MGSETSVPSLAADVLRDTSSTRLLCTPPFPKSDCALPPPSNFVIRPSPFAGALAAMPRVPLASLCLPVINGRIAKRRQPKPTPDVSRYIVREKLN
jgi:hypothetical protein